MRKRLEGDVWQGLYDFYLYESESKDLPEEQLLQELRQAGVPVQDAQAMPVSKTYKHILSHQKITAHFHRIKLHETLKNDVLTETRLGLYNVEEIESLPKPVLISSYLKDARILVSL